MYILRPTHTSGEAEGKYWRREGGVQLFRYLAATSATCSGMDPSYIQTRTPPIKSNTH